MRPESSLSLSRIIDRVSILLCVGSILLFVPACVKQAPGEIRVISLRAVSTLGYAESAAKTWGDFGTPYFDVTLEIPNLPVFLDSKLGGPYVLASYCEPDTSPGRITMTTIPKLSFPRLVDASGRLVGLEKSKTEFVPDQNNLFHAWLSSRSWLGNDAQKEAYFLPRDGRDVCLNLDSNTYGDVRVTNVVRIPFSMFLAALKATPNAWPGNSLILPQSVK